MGFKIITYNADQLFDIRFNPYYFNDENKEVYITTYEQCLLTDFLNYYIKNTYKDIITFFYGSNINSESPLFNIYLITDDFKKNIFDNIENIRSEIIGAYIYTLLNKLDLKINIENISNIEFYTDQISLINWTEYNNENFCFDCNNYLKDKLSYLKNYNDYFALNNSCTYLFNIFIKQLYTPYSYMFDLISKSKALLLKYNNNDIIYLINNHDYKYQNIVDYIKENNFYHYIIEKEYYACESNNKYIIINDFFKYYNYLKLFATVNNNQILKYNNIIKPWARENIYSNIKYIDEYRLIGLCKPLDYYGFDPSKRNYMKAFIDNLSTYKKIMNIRIDKLKRDVIYYYCR